MRSVHPMARVVTAVLAGAVLGSFAPRLADSTYAAFTGTTADAGNAFSSKRVFPGDRVVTPVDFRDASSGTEANKSDPSSFADGSSYRSTTGINSGSTNKYLEYTLSSSRPAGLPVSGATFRFSLASKGGGGSGNACFWFDVRSGGAVIGTHGSYAGAVGCSTGTTPVVTATAIGEVAKTDQVNGLVIRVYVWETGGKQVDVDLCSVTGATPYAPSFTAYEQQVVDTTSGTPATTVWTLAADDTTEYQSGSVWPSAGPAATKYLQVSLDPAVPTGATLNAVTLKNVWHAASAVSNGGTICYTVEVLTGSSTLATHGTAAAPAGCNSTITSVTDAIALAEVNDATKANGLVLKLHYWLSPLCGGGGNPACIRSVTDQVQVTYNYQLD